MFVTEISINAKSFDEKIDLTFRRKIQFQGTIQKQKFIISHLEVSSKL